MNPRAKRWHWPCRPIRKAKSKRVDGYGTQREHHIAPVHPSLSSRGKVRRSQSAATIAGGWCGIPHGFDRGIGRSQAVHLRSGRRAATPYSYHSHPWVKTHGYLQWSLRDRPNAGFSFEPSKPSIQVSAYGGRGPGAREEEDVQCDVTASLRGISGILDFVGNHQDKAPHKQDKYTNICGIITRKK